MPQTREHLAILQLLDIRQVIVALSKIDLIDDPEWIELVELEIDDLLSQSGFADVPVIPVSAETGAGLSALVTTLQQVLSQLSPRRQRPAATLAD